VDTDLCSNLEPHLTSTAQDYI